MTASTDPNRQTVPRRVLRLADLPAERRFAQWQEWMDDMMDVLPPSEWPGRAYDGQLDLHAAGDITISRCRSDAMRLRRSLARTSRDGQRGYVFQLFLAGDPGVVRVRGRETVVRRGDMLAIDFEQPIEMERPAYEAVGLFVPRDLVFPLVRGADIHGRVVNTRHGVPALAAGWIRQFLRQLPALTASEARGAAAAMLPLLCEAHSGRAAEGATVLGARELLLRRMLAFIDAHRDDPDLSPDALRLHFGLSRRQLYKAFDAADEGPAALIRQRRLAAARAELVLQPGTPVAQIAYGCGFASVSDFGRAFRREYGLSPSELRASSRASPVRRRGGSPPQPYARHFSG